MSGDLPQGWTTVRAIDVCDAIPNGSTPKSESMHSAAEIPFVKVYNLSFDGTLDFTKNPTFITRQTHEALLRRSRSRPGDVLMNIVGPPLGKVSILPDCYPEWNFNQAIVSFQVRRDCLDNRFLAKYLVHASGAWASRFSKATVGQHNIAVSDCREMELPLPPLNEQRRIVAKLEALQARSRRAREALDAVPPLLEKLRQSILAAAFRGDLTKDWRAKHLDVEPASELLKRIRAERRKKWEESELAKMRAKGKAPSDDRWNAKYKEPAPVDMETLLLPALPHGWCWASLGELLADDLANGRSVPTDDRGFPVLRLTALKHGHVDLRERKGGAWSADEAAPFLVRKNDFLVSRGNGSLSLVGRGGLVDDEPDGVAFPDTLIRVRAHDLVDRAYLARVWSSRLVRNQIERVAKTTAGIFKVSQGDLERIALPVANLEEQRHIASAVDAGIDRVRRLERSFATTLAAATSLDRAVLAKAFRGELVSQDPNDEPAAAMLARVRTEHGASTATNGASATRTTAKRASKPARSSEAT